LTLAGSQLPRSIAGLLAVALLAGCATAVDPWDQPVQGAESVSAWFDEDPLVIGTFGDGLPSTDEVLTGIRDMEVGRSGVAVADVSVGLLGDDGDATRIGYARMIVPRAGSSLRAMDLRFEIRHDAGLWRIVAMERRYHCAVETATELCQ